MKPAYYNTNGITGQLLLDYAATARKQDEAILQHLSHHPRRNFTAWELFADFGERMMLTSIRRSLHNLVAAGRIQEDGQRNGGAGRMVTAYRITI